MDFDTFESCHGCPYRVPDPNCHSTCFGYLHRQAKDRERLDALAKQHAANPKPPDAEILRRNKRLKKGSKRRPKS